MKKSGWYVYMVRCADNTLYTGTTNDLAKRLKAHNEGADGARYTRGRRPVALVYYESAGSRADAVRLEYRLKKLPRPKKELLVQNAALRNTAGGNEKD